MSCGLVYFGHGQGCILMVYSSGLGGCQSLGPGHEFMPLGVFPPATLLRPDWKAAGSVVVIFAVDPELTRLGILLSGRFSVSWLSVNSCLNIRPLLRHTGPYHGICKYKMKKFLWGRAVPLLTILSESDYCSFGCYSYCYYCCSFCLDLPFFLSSPWTWQNRASVPLCCMSSWQTGQVFKKGKKEYSIFSPLCQNTSCVYGFSEITSIPHTA